MEKLISIIIPIFPGDNEAEELLRFLDNHIPEYWEVIVSSPKEKGSRAYALNEGAKKANGKFLWFLHGDSRITKETIHLLEKSISEKPERLHYFKLKFYPDSILMRFNSIGANLRSYLLGCPYGDQSFCIAKDQFLILQGFDEDIALGEDLFFVWKTKEKSILLNQIRGYIQTSSRKYKSRGWLRITIFHHYMFWKLVFLWLADKGKKAIPKISE
ncbi:glycosyltransferase [Leptospira ilyithenensis]|uniref:Glycosyltransferase n=1 Tax=Leptospira ilyithenensis TaxID=2484901 RepID=A0A4R9LLH7_9LEPT|nr:glycosyltransferase [Leptospira ilyithenensis]TGN08475.1 glycosyltransferase [Leptospira ilyithenensis]